MSQLHAVKKLKEEDPGAWATLRGEIAARLNNNNNAKYSKAGEVQAMKAAQKKARR